MFKKILSAWAKYEKYVTLAALLIAVVFPMLSSKNYVLNVGILCLLYSLLSLSLNFVTGYTGIVVLGQAGFYGIGAYSYSILATKLGLTFLPATILAMAIAFCFGLLIGLPTLRLKGNYLSNVTMGFCEILRIVELNWTELTGGPFGLKNIPSPEIFGIAFKTPRMKYYLILALVVLTIIVIKNILASRSGRAFSAIKGDEVAAEAMGVNVFRYKLLAFAIAAAVAGLAGAFYGSYVNYIDSTNFSYNQSIQILSMTIMGGLGSIPGSIIGSVFFIILPEVLRFLTSYRQVFYGVALVLMIMFKPDGILGGFSLRQIRLFERAQKRMEGEGPIPVERRQSE